MRPSGFTLIELLVVISIIAVLASMLLPAISLVRGTAHALSCQNNLRQSAVMLVAYDTDHGQLPTAVDFALVNSNGWSRRGDWDIAVLDFSGETSTKFLTCPTDRSSRVATVTSVSGQQYTGRKSYAMVGTYHLADVPEARAATVSWTQLWNWSPAAVCGSTSVGRIASPSTALLLGERLTESETLGMCWYSMLGDSWAMAEVHRGKSNVVFADGHTASTTRAESIGSGTQGDVLEHALGMWTTTSGD